MEGKKEIDRLASELKRKEKMYEDRINSINSKYSVCLISISLRI